MADVSNKESNIRFRPDRIGKYFRKHLGDFVFSELSEEYTFRAGVSSAMRGVPVPMRKEDIKTFSENRGISPARLGENMAWVIGCDPHFKHAQSYVTFLRTVFDDRFREGITMRAETLASGGDLEGACVYYRAALCISPRDADAMYGYARVCRDMYLDDPESKDEEYVGLFKAESLDWFELLTVIHPDFPQPYYYLGFAYLNLGLYTKASLAWEAYLEKSEAEEAGETDAEGNGIQAEAMSEERREAREKDRAEIRSRLEELREPTEIEIGCNFVASGRFEQGLRILLPYADSKYKEWWPMSYYIGVAYARTGEPERAAEMFKRVLAADPSNVYSMLELAELYGQLGNSEQSEKYRRKAEVVAEQAEVLQ